LESFFMRLKSYFAGTVESAIRLARQEMGGDAMLVNSRRTLPESKHLGAYEVVFAAAQDSAHHVAAAAAHVQAEEPPSPQSPTLAAEMAEMRLQLTRMSALVSRSAVRNGLRSTTASNPALDGLDQTLAANDVDGDLACCMLRNLESLGPAASAAEIRQALRKDIQNRLTVSAELSPCSFETAGPGATPARTVAALVGPPGVGKTTMLAKLAMRFGISARRSTHIISYDSHRIAPSDQLRSYAAIMGVAFEALETVSALAQSLKENSRKDLILIDTPGYSAQDFGLSWDLTKFLSTYPHVDIHLVLSCGAKSSDISRMVDRYNTFAPAKLLFTRLDETDSYGAILNEPVRTGLPVSFLGTGPRIPEDFETATKDRIADLLLEGRESRAVASA
jgi:flagellar biosynthesis protein FlhF